MEFGDAVILVFESFLLFTGIIAIITEVRGMTGFTVEEVPTRVPPPVHALIWTIFYFLTQL